jgi:hypothetical protein
MGPYAPDAATRLTARNLTLDLQAKRFAGHAGWRRLAL